MPKLGKSLRNARQFFRDYTAGVRSQDLQRLFRRDAAEAYDVLTRDQKHPETRGLRGIFQRLRGFLLGLSYKLSPPRRVLFAVAMVSALLGLVQVQAGWHGRMVQIGFPPFYLLTSIALLVFLLALELVDRIRVRDELEVARQLQRELLPREAPQIPGWSFAHSYRTANEIGGDYYDFLDLPDSRLALVAGDASGHGMAAGLLMVIAHSTLRLAADLDPSPQAVAQLLNRALARTGGSRAFLTLFYGLLEPESGALSYVCSGHPFPLLRRADGRIEELGQGSYPLGLRQEIDLTPASVRISSGDLLLIYSDGLPEAVQAPSGGSFGFDRVRGLLAPGGTPQAVHDRILLDFDSFLGGESPQDDITLVVVGRNDDDT